MKTIEINLYKFNELSEEAKKYAINKNSCINVEYDWWKTTYEDAERVGLKLITFDLERNKHAKGKIIGTHEETARLIEREHGEECETFKLAKRYLLELQEIEDNNDLDGEEEKNGIIYDLNDTFLNDLLELYANMLQKECYYLQSEEAIIETLTANDYDFTEKGDIYP